MAIPPRVSVLIGARALMSWNVSAGKPRQSQPEHKRSRKTQAGQTPKQRNKRTALRENVPRLVRERIDLVLVHDDAFN